MGWESFDVVGFDLGPLLQGQTTVGKLKSCCMKTFYSEFFFLICYSSTVGLPISIVNLENYCSLPSQGRIQPLSKVGVHIE